MVRKSPAIRSAASSDGIISSQSKRTVQAARAPPALSIKCAGPAFSNKHRSRKKGRTDPNSADVMVAVIIRK